MGKARLDGIDVSYAQGKIDWKKVKTAGIDFAIIKASQGKLLANPRSGAFTDPQFKENMKGAAAVGIPVGVYHYLCAGNVKEAEKEANYFLSVIRPWREKIKLWAVCDAEEDKYLPKNKNKITEAVNAFLVTVRDAGFRPMLYSNPNYLRNRLGDMSRFDLWLAYWDTTEARALAYNPKIWQYGAKSCAGLKKVDANYGYFNFSEEITHSQDYSSEKNFRKGDRVRVLNPVVYGTDRKFGTYYPEYDVISVSGDRVVIGIGTTITAAVAAENLEKA